MDQTTNNELLNLIKSLQNDINELKNAKIKSSKKQPKKKTSKTTKKSSKKTVKKNITLPSKEEEVKILEEQVNKAPIFNKRVRSGQAQFEKNSWVDDGKLCTADKLHHRKYGDKFQVQERGGRESARLVKITCDKCKREFEVMSSQIFSDYFVCSKCCGGK